MKNLVIIFIFFFSFSFSQIPVGYYNSAQGLTGYNLKVALHNIIKNHTQITYSGLWGVFTQTDSKTNAKVWDIYSYKPTGTQPYEYSFGTNQCGTYNSEGDCYNREHSWPQSWFNSTTGPDSDLFHIYPTDGEVNGKRSNFPYGNVSSPTWTSMNGSKLGPCTNQGYNLTVFEPINEFKGDLARSYFYMSTRYFTEDATWGASDATNKSVILPWQLNVLIQWHHQDPVSAKEIARNNSIYYNYQNNRNPYIDNPVWADSVFTSKANGLTDNKLFASTINIFPNPTSDNLFIKINDGYAENLTITIHDVFGRLINYKNNCFDKSITINCADWEKGTYFINIKNQALEANYKFFKE
jgi:endonuclease I